VLQILKNLQTIQNKEELANKVSKVIAIIASHLTICLKGEIRGWRGRRQ